VKILVYSDSFDFIGNISFLSVTKNKMDIFNLIDR